MSTSYKAAVQALSVLGKVGAAAIGLSALTILTGWHEVNIYYSTLNASWVRSLYSPKMFLMVGHFSVVMLAATSYVALIILIRRDYSERKFQQISNILVAIGLCISFTNSLFLKNWISDELLVEAIFYVGRVIFVLGVGMNFAGLVRRLRDDQLEWNEKHFGLMLLWLYFGLVMSGLPHIQYQAMRDSSPTSKLPIVKIKHEDLSWKMTSAGEKLILMQVQNDGRLRFRAIDPESAEWIEKSN